MPSISVCVPGTDNIELTLPHSRDRSAHQSRDQFQLQGQTNKLSMAAVIVASLTDLPLIFRNYIDHMKPHYVKNKKHMDSIKKINIFKA